MGKIIDKIRSQKLCVLQLLSHGIKTFGKPDKFPGQVQMDPDMEIAFRKLVNGFDQVTDGF